MCFVKQESWRGSRMNWITLKRYIMPSELRSWPVCAVKTITCLLAIGVA
jgi:hypothetical protein